MNQGKRVSVVSLLLWVYFLAISVVYGFCYFDVPAIGDTGCFAAVAHGMREGKILYQQIWDNKAPGIFFIHVFFQTISGNWIHYFILIPLFFQCILWFSLIPFLKSNYSNNVLILGALLAFPILLRLTHFETVFVSGYTEEIGIYLVASAFFLFFKNGCMSILRACISGILFGLAIWIKEPFVFLGLPWFIYWILERRIKPLLWFTISTLTPTLCFLIYLAMNDSLASYFKYLEFALLYSGGNNNVSMFYRNGFKLLFDFFSHSYYLEAIFMILGFIIAIFFKRKTQPHSILRYLGWLLIGSIPFILMGNTPYGHYYIPLLFLATLFSIFTLLFLFFTWNKAGILDRYLCRWVIIIIEVIFISIPFSKVLFINSNKLMWLGSAKKENEEINAIVGSKKLSIYVDDAHLGRAYNYLGRGPLYKHAVPYATYYVPKHMPVYDNILSENRSYIHHAFKNNPPDIIFTGAHLGYGIAYSDLSSFVLRHYNKIDSVYWGQERYFLLKKIK